jgi:hypothetical protein
MPKEEYEETGIIEEILGTDNDEEIEVEIEIEEPEDLEEMTEEPAKEEVVRADPTGEIANALKAIQRAYTETKTDQETTDERLDRISKILRKQGWDL